MYLAVIGPLLGALSLLLLGVAVVLFAGLATARTRSLLASVLAGETRALLAVAWLAAATATAGSLYFSNVVGFRPCLLCWWQRIAMYPLVLVLGVAVITADRRAWRYALPLAAAGALISAYHVFIQFLPAMDVVACSADAPCTVRYLAIFGFMSIPVLAGAGFLGIAALVLAARQADVAHEADPRSDAPVLTAARD